MFCTACYGNHSTDAQRQQCAQAQVQTDAVQTTMRHDFARRFADACKWCGAIHTTSAERAQCMLDNT